MSVVIKSSNLGFLWDGDDGGAFEAWGKQQAPVICWRSVWRWEPAGQHRFLGRLVTHRHGLPGAFLLLFFLKTWRASSSLICSAGVGERGVAGGENGFFFSRAHLVRLPVVDSPQCWGMVSCNWWCLPYLSTPKQNHWKIICSLAFQNNLSLLFWFPFPVCIWPVYTRRCRPSCNITITSLVKKHNWWQLRFHRREFQLSCALFHNF